MLRVIFLALVFSFSLAPLSRAQDTSLCGPPPTASVMKELSEKTKGDIQGKAQAISKFLGSADLGGKIETERKTLYQTSDSSEAMRNDRYLFYVTCILLMKDQTTTLKEKLEAIRALRRPIQVNPSKSELMQQLLASFRKDTPRDKIREMLGAPISRSTISVGEGQKNSSYTLERYQGEYADVFVVGNEPFPAIAVYIKEEEKQPKGIAPIPYYVINGADGYEGLGDLSLMDLRETCRGNFSDGNARFLYVMTPVCYFGRGGGYNHFVFSFYAGGIGDTCNLDILELSAKTPDDIKCNQFWALRPNFVLTYLGDDSNPEAQALSFAWAVIGAIYWKI